MGHIGFKTDTVTRNKERINKQKRNFVFKQNKSKDKSASLKNKKESKQNTRPDRDNGFPKKRAITDPRRLSETQKPKRPFGVTGKKPVRSDNTSNKSNSLKKTNSVLLEPVKNKSVDQEYSSFIRSNVSLPGKLQDLPFNPDNVLISDDIRFNKIIIDTIDGHDTDLLPIIKRNNDTPSTVYANAMTDFVEQAQEDMKQDQKDIEVSNNTDQIEELQQEDPVNVNDNEDNGFVMF